MTTRYLALMPHAWGVGSTIKEAIRHAKRNRPSFVKSNAVRVWLVGPGAQVNGDGDIVYPKGETAPQLAYSTDYAV